MFTFLNHYLFVTVLVIVFNAVFSADVDDDYEDVAESFPKFNLRSSDFAEIATTSSLVDKSLFIKTFVEDNGVVILTAPHRFGKSTNINMIKRFLEIEVDDEGNKMSNATNIRIPVRDTENYDLFVKNKLKIAENETFMDYHFGKHPVIYVDFDFNNVHVINYDLAVDHIKYIIHRCYVEHYYLTKSDRLNSEERMIVKRWCSTSGYSEMTESDVNESLRLLSRILYRHYENRRVYVLVDNFDSPAENAILFAPTEHIMGGIYRLLSSVVLQVLQKNFHAHRGIISGVSYIAIAPALYSLGYVKVCRFLEDHSYAGFHGFTRDEAKDLFTRAEFNLSSEMINRAEVMYGGFQTCNNMTLFNPWSVINLLLTKIVRNYWKEPGIPFNLDSLLLVPDLRREIDSLIKGKESKVRLKKIYAPDDVIRLRDVIAKPELHVELHNTDIVLTFLLELGYLTFVPVEQTFIGKKRVKIPNREVKKEFMQRMKKYEKHYATNTHKR